MEKNKNVIWDYLDGVMPADQQAAFEAWLEEDRNHLCDLVRQAALDRGVRSILRQETATTAFVESSPFSEDLLHALVEQGESDRKSVV